MPISDLETERVQQLAVLPEDDLYRLVAEEMLGKQAMPSDPRELLDQGKRIFRAQARNVQEAICKSSHLREFAQGKSDVAEIAIEILKIVSAIVIKISPITLCVLIARTGLKNLCAEEWVP